MPEKKGFWKKLEQSRMLQWLFFVVSMAVIVGAYFPLTKVAEDMREKRDIKDMNLSVDYDFLYDFETIENVDNAIEFEGWALRLDSKNIGISVVLDATDGSDTKVLLAETTERKDVEEYVGKDTEFGECGFLVDIKENQLAENVCYEVQLALHYEGEPDTEGNTDYYIRTATNQYLYNGQIYRYDPTNFEEPQIDDADLSNVIKNGMLCTYSMEHRACIYLHDDKLYCIADSEHWVPLEKSPSVPTVFYTLFPDLIPEERKEKYEARGYDSREIYLNEKSYYSGHNIIYGVTVIELPDYPITYIRTGTYDNKGNRYVFRGSFLMDISFK